MKLRKSWVSVILVMCVLIAAILHSGCSSESKEKVEGSSVISTTSTSWTLSTPDANKDKHAHFILEFGWSNEDKAGDAMAANPTFTTSNDGVDLVIDFHTDWGQFFFMPPPGEQVSYDENGITKYKWIVELDIGAKNEDSNPIHYHISATARGMESLTPPEEAPDYYSVWLKGSIAYVPYP